MDFNDIQSAWDDNNEKSPTNLEKIQTANTPLDKIKKILKRTYFSNLNSIVVRICTCDTKVDYSLYLSTVCLLQFQYIT
jgi:hypothetical protein